MVEWFEALSILSQIFFCIAVPATLLLMIQLILLIIGLGQGDADADTPDEVDVEVPDGGLRLFTLWGLITFFTVLGWSGFAMAQQKLPGMATTLIALALGTLAMMGMAQLMRSMLGLQQNGILEINNALGCSGQVYLTIPADRAEPGKVTLLVQGRYAEFSAVTDEDAPIPSGAEITVVGVVGQNTLVVRTTVQGGKQAWNG